MLGTGIAWAMGSKDSDNNNKIIILAYDLESNSEREKHTYNVGDWDRTQRGTHTNTYNVGDWDCLSNGSGGFEQQQQNHHPCS